MYTQADTQSHTVHTLTQIHMETHTITDTGDTTTHIRALTYVHTHTQTHVFKYTVRCSTPPLWLRFYFPGKIFLAPWEFKANKLYSEHCHFVPRPGLHTKFMATNMVVHFFSSTYLTEDILTL